MKNLLQKTLAILAKATIRRYQPVIIGITGSVGKTSTREAIYTVLKAKYRVRRSEKNYNTEIGVPLTILGVKHHGRNIIKWISALIRVAIRILIRAHEYPEILVLEMGADRPGDIKYLVGIAKPFIAVMTAIGEIPAHVEFFSGPLELAEEKAELFKALPPDGFAVYNIDDEAVVEVKERTPARKTSFGFDEHANFRIANYEIRILAKDGKDTPDGVSFKIEHKESVVPIRLHDGFGKPQVYAAAAACSVGFLFRLNLVEISQALEGYVPPPGRSRFLPGIKGSWIIDDSYNASPESTRAGLELLGKLPARRRISVLGDMLEIGKYTEEAHRVIGDYAAEVCDILFTVGDRAKFIADEARVKKTEVFVFDNPTDAGRKLDEILREGDLVLVKGSQAMRLEKTVEEIMAEPERAKELLVRQDEEWRRKVFLHT
ncbi:MAG: hypothetical protein HYW90_00035 [Candidatus Sungbacteria bacterium]|nr:hypothetical protein [Candidatus Sungbacteria bacterium]